MGAAEVGVTLSESHRQRASSGWLEPKEKIDKGVMSIMLSLLPREGMGQKELDEEKVGMCVLVSLCLHTKARGGLRMFSSIILDLIF